MKKALHPKTDEPIRVIVTKLPEHWKQAPGTDHIRLSSPADAKGNQRYWSTYLDTPSPIDDDIVPALAASGAEWRYAEGSRRIEGIDPPDELRAAAEKLEPGPVQVIVSPMTGQLVNTTEIHNEAELRDRFAIAALTYLTPDFGHTPEAAAECAKVAYVFADAMIAERDKRKT